MSEKWGILASDEALARTISSLNNNGIKAELAKDRGEAIEKALQLVREGGEIMVMTSVTLDQLGLTEKINNSDKFVSAREELNKGSDKREKKKLGSAPEYAIGSVHAITENGEILVASNTGSQIPAYAYGSDKVIFVVGTQKIVKNIEDGFKRIYEHSLPMESERAKKAYGVPGSSVNKILIINKEGQSGRIHIIFVPEVLGF